MSMILNLETSTKNCSVSISNFGKQISLVEENSKEYLHSEKLHTFIKYALNLSKIRINDLKSVCVNRGPGSYSSLRIGISAAKGLCISLGIPLISLDTLTILVQVINEFIEINYRKNILIIPMIEAKKNFFYTSLFNSCKKRILPILLKKKDKNFINFFFRKKNSKFFLIKNFYYPIKNPCIKKELLSTPSASYMNHLSYIKFCNKQFHDLNNFSPIYL